MICIINKNKVIACLISGMLVLFLFVIGMMNIKNQDIELIKVASNDIVSNNTVNYIKNKK